MDYTEKVHKYVAFYNSVTALLEYFILTTLLEFLDIDVYTVVDASLGLSNLIRGGTRVFMQCMPYYKPKHECTSMYTIRSLSYQTELLTEVLKSFSELRTGEKRTYQCDRGAEA